MLSIVLFIFLFSLIIVLSIINESNGVLCPPPSTIPCVCNATTKEIICRGSYIKLDEVFEELVKFIPEKERDFDSFYLNVRGLTTLEANTFKGIRFETVFLGGSKLTYLHKDAFLGTESHIKELFAFATNLSIGDTQEYNLFESISSLTNLQRLLISGSNIKHIPDRYDMIYVHI
jgi:Leucine-rich repeat (LRR) protein